MRESLNYKLQREYSLKQQELKRRIKEVIESELSFEIINLNIKEMLELSLNIDKDYKRKIVFEYYNEYMELKGKKDLLLELLAGVIE